MANISASTQVKTAVNDDIGEATRLYDEIWTQVKSK